MNYYVFGGLLFAAYVLFVVFRIYKKIKNDFQKIYGQLRQIDGFRHSTYFVGNHSDKVIAVDEKAQLICLLSDIQTQGQHQLIRYASIVSASVEEDGQVIMAVPCQDNGQEHAVKKDGESGKKINKLVFKLVYQQQQSLATFELAVIDEKKAMHQKEGGYTVAMERARDWQTIMASAIEINQKTAALLDSQSICSDSVADENTQ